jgi:O-antigen biosynthesis protein
MKIKILTRCTRTENLPKVRDSIFSQSWKDVDVNWVIIFDTSSIATVDSKILSEFSMYDLKFWEGIQGDMGHGLLNRVMDETSYEEWVYVLDDDNEMHPSFAETIIKYSRIHPSIEGFVFSQNVDGKDFTGLSIREARPENMKLRSVDMAQVLLRKSLIGNKRLVPMTYVADGIWIEELYKESPQSFFFVESVLCNYNSLKELPKKSRTLPRVLVMDSLPDLKSWKAFDFESDDLNIESASNEDTNRKISEFDPDCIVTSGESYEKYTSLMSLPYDFRQRWIHLPDLNNSASGESAYICGMNYILSADRNDLVSIITPIYNTGEKLRRTYQSVVNQTHTNWEWVLVNDSTDIVTLKIAEEIASNDPRVKVYDFKEKTRGIIGEAKYRACALSNGNYIMELDHDDFLLNHALSKMIEAFRKYPDAGFVYSDCAEIDEHYNSLTYGDGFSFGYGSYREETHMGIAFKVADTANINPLTIRHIVGVPNHFRAWRRDIYFQTGGHNRRLSITDDYELVMKTFLITKFVKVPLCCYLQFYHGSNSQDVTRSDIQRRVRTIAVSYGSRIKKRFEELGKEDWAYAEGTIPWNIPPRKGEEEGFVNYILE